MNFLRSGLIIVLVGFIASCGGGSGGSFQGSIFSPDGGAAAGQYSGILFDILSTDLSAAAAEPALAPGEVFLTVTDSGEFSAVVASPFDEETLQLVGFLSVDELSDIDGLSPGNEEEELILEFCSEVGDANKAAWIDGFTDFYVDGALLDDDDISSEGLIVIGALCIVEGKDGFIEEKALFFVVTTDDGELLPFPFIVGATYISQPDDPQLGTEPLKGVWGGEGSVGTGFCVGDPLVDCGDILLSAAVLEEPETEVDFVGDIGFEIEDEIDELGTFYGCDMEGTFTSDGIREYLASGTLECLVSGGARRKGSVEPAVEADLEEFDFNGILAACAEGPCTQDDGGVDDFGVNELNGSPVEQLLFTIEIPDLEFVGYAELSRQEVLD